MLCSVNKECAKVWRAAQQLVESNLQSSCQLAKSNTSTIYHHHQSPLQRPRLCMSCSVSKECAKIWKEARQLAEVNANAAGTDVQPGLFMIT